MALWGYREIDPVGGYDPYSASKECLELVTINLHCYIEDTKSKQIHWAKA